MLQNTTIIMFLHGAGHVTLHAISLLCTSSSLILVQFPMHFPEELSVHSHNPYTWGTGGFTISSIPAIPMPPLT